MWSVNHANFTNIAHSKSKPGHTWKPTPQIYGCHQSNVCLPPNVPFTSPDKNRLWFALFKWSCYISNLALLNYKLLYLFKLLLNTLQEFQPYNNGKTSNEIFEFHSKAIMIKLKIKKYYSTGKTKRLKLCKICVGLPEVALYIPKFSISPDFYNLTSSVLSQPDPSLLTGVIGTVQ